MYRKELIDTLLDQPRTLQELAELLETRMKDLESDLNHLRQSLKHGSLKMEIEPAKCNKCGFRFKADKLHKPSKCPQCHSHWIEAPVICIRDRK